MKSRPILLTPTRKHSLAGDEITPNTQRAVRTYFQRHHIIPKFIWKDDNFSSNLKELGFKRDDRINMVTLPMVRFIPEKISAYATPSSAKTFGERSAHSSLHGGAHGTAYISHIKKGLEQIFDGNLPKNKKKRQLREFLSKTRNELLSGFLRLNSLEETAGVCHVEYNKNPAFKYIDRYFQVHHLIPLELFNKKGSAAYKLLENLHLLGNPHFLGNLSSLPTAHYLPEPLEIPRTPMLGRSTTGRTAHNGSHPVYTAMIEGKLCTIWERYFERRSPVKKAKRKARNAVFALLRNTKKKLYSGELTLN